MRKSGSYPAASGFENEKAVVKMLNGWKDNPIAQDILESLGVDISSLTSVYAEKVKGNPKPDVKVTLNGGTQVYLSLKKSEVNFNHLCRTSVDNYATRLGFDDSVAEVLKVFTGFVSPAHVPEILEPSISLKDTRRANLNEVKSSRVQEVKDFFQQNRDRVLEHVFCGADQNLKPSHMVITNQANGQSEFYTFSMKEVMDFYRQGYSAGVTPRGSIDLGQGLTVQRKGGQGSPTNLQFKFKPSVIVDFFKKNTLQRREDGV